MTEGVRTVLEFAFGPLRLHRVAAGYVPHNVRSGAVLRRLGFNVDLMLGLNEPDRVLGTISLSAIQRGPAQYCNLGYQLAETRTRMRLLPRTASQAAAYPRTTQDSHPGMLDEQGSDVGAHASQTDLDAVEELFGGPAEPANRLSPWGGVEDSVGLDGPFDKLIVDQEDRC